MLNDSESGLTNMLIVCLFFYSTSEPEYAYKRYAYKKTCIYYFLIMYNDGSYTRSRNTRWRPPRSIAHC